MYSEYSMKVIEHFMSPRNVGSMTEPDGEGTYGDLKCGDSLTVYLKVEDETIKDISFLVFGCTASIATSSMITEMAKGKTIDEAMAITEKELIDALDGLPQSKLHCSVLGVKGLRAAINNYKEKKENGDV
ncbi:MAG: iron-sulfur cluster assembly scaffold protein [Tissierellaceae bacterium]